MCAFAHTTALKHIFANEAGVTYNVTIDRSGNETIHEIIHVITAMEGKTYMKKKRCPANTN